MPAPVLPRGRLPAAVVLLGVTSFFADVASEMGVPLLPAFLTGTLGASATYLGLVEGTADTVASLVKLLSGRWSDRLPRRKPLVVLGYALAGACKPLVGLASAAWHVLAVRFVDRVGKGLRSSPRDALIAESVAPPNLGFAYGFHRAMDHAGALCGSLLASALVAAGLGVRAVLVLAVVPAAGAVAAALSVREAPRAAAPRPLAAASAPVPLPTRLRAYLVILLGFALGNSSDAFLLLRAGDLGVPVAAIPLLWAALHVVKSLATAGFGRMADRVPRTRLILSGWAVYAAVYLGFAAASAAWQVWALFLVYGLYYGLCEPAEKALVRDLAPEEALGRAFGAYHFVTGLTALPASLLTGWLWRAHGPAVALGVGAAFALASALALLLLLPRVADPAGAKGPVSGP